MNLLKQQLLTRFVALAVLTFCVAILSGSAPNTAVLKMSEQVSPSPQKNMPSVQSNRVPDAPLAISELRTVSWDGQNLEIAMDLVNVSQKTIRAYAIRQTSDANNDGPGQVMFTSFDASNNAVLQPNQTTTTFDVVGASSSTEARQVIVIVDYVEFSDGTKWGRDLGRSAERSAGQRAAAYILSKRLLKILDRSTPGDVLVAIDNGETNIEPPSTRSSEWKAGFRFGCKAMAQSLKRAHSKGRLDFELRQFAETFRSAE